MATDLVLFSKVDEPWFRERVKSGAKIHCVGHPRLEMIRASVGPTTAGDPNELPRIAFFSQPSEPDYTRDLRVQDWAILAGLKGRAEVKFRLHPREDRSAALEDLAAAGAEYVEISEAGLTEDLAWCDGIASSWSTVSMEAAACGRAVFWTCANPERYPASADLRDQHIGTLISSPDGWGRWLEECQSGEWLPPAIVADERLRELGMIGDTGRSWLERLDLGTPITENFSA